MKRLPDVDRRCDFEIFAPHQWLLNARYGPHYVGIEHQADMDDVRAVIAAHDIRIVRDLGPAMHAHPAHCLGVAFEFWSGSFRTMDWPLLGGPMRSADAWRDEHPLGLAGLKGYTLVTPDVDGAMSFLRRFLGAEVPYDEGRPAVAARAVGLRVADAVCELLTPVKGGPIAQHLARYGQGIRSTVFEIRDVDQARRYFEGRGIEVVPGAAPTSVALSPEDNLGVIFEFSA